LFAFNISHGYQISIKFFFISIAFKGKYSTYLFNASVISYSHLLDILIFLAISIIFEFNLYTHKFAKFHIKTSGFSIISLILLSESTLKTQYISGFGTCFTNTQYHLYSKIFFKSLLLKIESQFIITRSKSASKFLIAAHVQFSSH
jgi:hypothetical protein